MKRPHGEGTLARGLAGWAIHRIGGRGSFSAENNTGGVRQPRHRVGTAGGQQGRRARGLHPQSRESEPQAEEDAADGQKRAGGS